MAPDFIFDFFFFGTATAVFLDEMGFAPRSGATAFAHADTISRPIILQLTPPSPSEGRSSRLRIARRRWRSMPQDGQRLASGMANGGG
jgi:hypothetical protein